MWGRGSDTTAENLPGCLAASSAYVSLMSRAAATASASFSAYGGLAAGESTCICTPASAIRSSLTWMSFGSCGRPPGRAVSGRAASGSLLPPIRISRSMYAWGKKCAWMSTIMQSSWRKRLRDTNPNRAPVAGKAVCYASPACSPRCEVSRARAASRALQ